MNPDLVLEEEAEQEACALCGSENVALGWAWIGQRTLTHFCENCGNSWTGAA